MFFLSVLWLIATYCIKINKAEYEKRQFIQTELSKKTKSLTLLKTIAEAANESSSLNEMVQITLNKICDFTCWPIGHVYEKVQNSEKLMLSKYWYLEDELRFKEFKKISDNTEFEPNVGLPGKAYALKKPVWLKELSSEQHFQRLQSTVGTAIKTGFAFPILVENKPVLVFEFFAEEIQEPDEFLLELMTDVAIQLGRVVEREQAERNIANNLKEIERKEHYLRSILENAIEGIITIDKKGTILSVNPATENIFGYSADEMLDQNVKMLMPPPYHDEHDGYLKNYDKTGEKKIIGIGREVIGKRKDSSTFAMDLAVSENKSGDALSFTGIVRDISEQVEYQKKIEDQKEYYENLFKFLNVPAFILDNDHKVVMWNKACEEITGVMANDLLGTRNHSLAFYRESRPVLADVVLDGVDASALYEFAIEESIMPGGKRVHNWIDRPHKSGGLIYISVEAGPVYTKNEQVGAIEIIQDITSIKKLEESLKKNNEQLKRSNEELERFAYVASHDLQEPLRMVASYTNLLAKRYKDKLDDDANDFINFSVDGAKRMQTLINDLLAFSRLNNICEEFSGVDTDVLVSEIIEVVNNFEDDVVITKDKLPEVKGLKVTLRQLFQNIIFNAVKYSDPSRKNEIHISAEEQNEKWTFSISDTGIGIAPEYFEKIFVIFKRLHNKDTYSGTGIGLALCKKIVEQHDGKIWIESVPDKGSTFIFTLLKG